MKKILIYIGHPAQFHFFKNAIVRLKNEGHKVIILIKSKDILEQLLKESGFLYHNIQSRPRGKSKFGILKASLQRTLSVTKIAIKEKVDILVGTDSSVAQAGWLLCKPSITTLEDDYDIIKNLAILTYPFTSKIVVPNVCSVGKWTNKKVGYDGYMKLAYLHPNYFTPDSSVIESYRLPHKFILVRLAKLTAHHDKGINGLNFELLKSIKRIANRHGYEIKITSEVQLPHELADDILKINHLDIHSVMSAASLLVSDSQSMTVEAAMIGLPSIRYSDFSGKISVLEELEKKYQLTVGLQTGNPENLLNKLEEMLSMPDLRETYSQRNKKMLADKIDVTNFLVSEIINTSSRN